MTLTNLTTRAIGAPLDRIDGEQKVRGTARYAFEHPVTEPLYLHAVQATIASGRVNRIDASHALEEAGVVDVITHENAPKLASIGNRELEILQDDSVDFRGQFIAAVIARTPETARYAASLVEVSYDERPHDVTLSTDRDDLYAPERVNGGFESDTDDGDVESALASASVTLDRIYTTPMEHNNPMEPHASIAVWDSGGLTLYDSTQGVHWTRQTLAPLFGLEEDRVRVISPHVGGGFGSKGLPHANVVLVALAARLMEGRPVKFALTRQQMFSVAGHRTPTIQHVRLGADEEGRLEAISFDATEHTSKIVEFAEQTAVPTRMMYASENRRTTHRLAPLDVPVPSWMRAPGEAPGMFGTEVAMDELAEACDLDPIELRVRNEPELDPESGLPYSSRNLVSCFREGARRFGWEERDAAPRSRSEGSPTQGEWLVGFGVASTTYPVFRMPGSSATIRLSSGGRYEVRIGAADIGTGTWTALTQISADALGVEVEEIELEIGDSSLPSASGAGGSTGVTCWGSAIVEAARQLRERLDENGPAEGIEVTAAMPSNPYTRQYAMHSFGAQFAEARVNADTGEVRVPRLTGVFAAGQIINAKTARSQLLGGMTMGLSMALHEHSVFDQNLGSVVNQDLAEYHIPVNADIGEVNVHFLDEDDPYVNPMGSKGIGELGIVGTAAAISNAVYNATGIRVRDLPVTPDGLLEPA